MDHSSGSLQVCKTLAELEAFADDLIDNKNKHARKLATTIMHEVVPPLFAQELVHTPLSFFACLLSLPYCMVRHHL